MRSRRFRTSCSGHGPIASDPSSPPWIGWNEPFESLDRTRGSTCAATATRRASMTGSAPRWTSDAPGRRTARRLQRPRHDRRHSLRAPMAWATSRLRPQTHRVMLMTTVPRSMFIPHAKAISPDSSGVNSMTTASLLSGEELGTQVIDSFRSSRAISSGMDDFTLEELRVSVPPPGDARWLRKHRPSMPPSD